MEQKYSYTYHRRITRMITPPELVIDLTVDSPVSLPHTRMSRRRIRSNRSGAEAAAEAESSQITSSQAADLELIHYSDEPVPLKKRSRAKKSTENTPVIDLEDTLSSEEAIQMSDSMTGEGNFLICPICFENLTTKRKPMSTRCGHVYCSECIEHSLNNSKKCPKCQSSITRKSCIRLYF